MCIIYAITCQGYKWAQRAYFFSFHIYKYIYTHLYTYVRIELASKALPVWGTIQRGNNQPPLILDRSTPQCLIAISFTPWDFCSAAQYQDHRWTCKKYSRDVYWFKKLGLTISFVKSGILACRTFLCDIQNKERERKSHEYHAKYI